MAGGRPNEGGGVGAPIGKERTAAAFKALKRHDLAQFMTGWRGDAVFFCPGNLPASGTHQGKAAVEAWFRRPLGQFPTIGFEVQDICARNLLDLVGTNVPAVHSTRGMVNRDGYEVRDGGVTVITSKWGRAVRVNDFFDMGEGSHRMWSAG